MADCSLKSIGNLEMRETLEIPRIGGESVQHSEKNAEVRRAIQSVKYLRMIFELTDNFTETYEDWDRWSILRSRNTRRQLEQNLLNGGSARFFAYTTDPLSLKRSDTATIQMNVAMQIGFLLIRQEELNERMGQVLRRYDEYTLLVNDLKDFFWFTTEEEKKVIRPAIGEYSRRHGHCLTLWLKVKKETKALFEQIINLLTTAMAEKLDFKTLDIYDFGRKLCDAESKIKFDSNLPLTKYSRWLKEFTRLTRTLGVESSNPDLFQDETSAALIQELDKFLADRFDTGLARFALRKLREERMKTR